MLKTTRWFRKSAYKKAKREKCLRLTKENWEQLQIDERNHVEQCSAFPEVIELELTKACNFTCTHCGTHGSKDLHRTHNQFPPIKTKLVDQLAQDVFPYLRRIRLVGEGEPLMAPRRLLLRLFRHLEQTATFVDLSTNGSLLDSKLISSMLPVLANIHFSVEAATPETYHKIRGSRAFYSVIDTIKMMTELKHEVPKGERPFNVILNYALRKSNCSELIDFLRMAAEWRVDGVFVRQLLVHFPSMRSETLVDKPEILNPLIEQAEQEAEKLGLSVILPAYIKGTQSANTLSQASKSAGTSQTEPQNENDTRKPKRINCSFLWRCMNIRSTGHIFACNALNAPLLGNLETKTFADMWNGEILREMRKRLDTSDPHPVCRACWMYEVGYLDSFDTSDSQRNFSLKTATKPREKSYNVSAFIQEKIDDA